MAESPGVARLSELVLHEAARNFSQAWTSQIAQCLNPPDAIGPTEKFAGDVDYEREVASVVFKAVAVCSRRQQ
jgi:hypothetical protein